MPARWASPCTMACSLGFSAGPIGWAPCMRSTAESLPHQAQRFMAAAMASAISAPCWPPIAQPTAMNRAVSPAISTSVRK